MTLEYFILSIGNTGTFCSLLINTEAACFMVKSGPCEACSQKKKNALRVTDRLITGYYMFHLKFIPS